MAAACFAVLSLDPSVLGLAAHATHFVTLFAVAGALLIARPEDRLPVREHFLEWFALWHFDSDEAASVLFRDFRSSSGSSRQTWLRPKRTLLRDTDRLRRGRDSSICPRLSFILAVAGVFSQFWFWTVSTRASMRPGRRLRQGVFEFSFEVRSLLQFGSASYGWHFGRTLVLFSFERLPSLGLFLDRILGGGLSPRPARASTSDLIISSPSFRRRDRRRRRQPSPLDLPLRTQLPGAFLSFCALRPPWPGGTSARQTIFRRGIRRRLFAQSILKTRFRKLWLSGTTSGNIPAHRAGSPFSVPSRDLFLCQSEVGYGLHLCLPPGGTATVCLDHATRND